MKRPLFLHPFLLAASPVLALFVSNLGQVPAEDVLRPLAASLLLALLLYAGLRAILRDGLRAALLTTVILLLVFSYGHVYGLIEGMRVGGVNLGRHRFLAPLWGGLLLGGGWAVVRWGKRGAALNAALNLMAALLCLLPALTLLGGAMAARTLPAGPASSPELAPATPAGSRPSVYYILLDGYARQDILSEVFSYDNKPFLDSLRARGFQIADASHSNYGNTALSLASSLNMEYLETLAGPLDEHSRDLEPMFALIQDSRIERVFEAMGYTTVALASGYRGTELRSMDRYLSPDVGSPRAQSLFGRLTPFEGMLIQTSAGLLLTELNASLPPRLRLDLEAPYTAHRARLEFALLQIPQATDRPQPEFLFAHLVLPHPPFVFGPGGESVQHTSAFTLGDSSYRGDYAGYLEAYTGQVTFLNARLERLLDELLESSDSPPVIILQSDHGSGATGLRSAESRVSYQDERFANLIAIYAPSCPALEVYPTLTPVNVFRLILRACYGLPYDPLPDSSYFSNYVRPYALRDITDDLSR